MMLGRIRRMRNWMFSASPSVKLRYMLEMPPVQYRALSVETTLFQWVLIISIEDVCVDTLP